MLAVNVTAPVLLAPPMRATAARSSTSSPAPTPRFFSYSLIKAALHAATVTMAQALAPRLRVNAVAPAPTLPSRRQREAHSVKQAESLPLRRGPSPEDIAAAGARGERDRRHDGGQHLAWRTPDSDLTE